ncbi:spore germination protein [Bacillus salipaludis]|uniref:spore germination protein n=1 Tax=Bacillus salipaludis TaxID=2547811 RepID=UPI002E1E27DB|nr:spore germination protein [Bacillus salipaludis]
MKRPLFNREPNKQPSDIGKSTFECLVEFIKDAFGNTEDLLMLPILYHEEKGILFYLETISDSEKIQESILVPLSKNPELDFGDIHYTAETKSKIMLGDTINALLQGNTILIVQGEDNLFSFNTKKDLSRSPQEPDSEKKVRGSHIGFVESLSTNLAFIRQAIQSNHLRINYHRTGQYTNTQIAVVYMEGIANLTLVKRLEERLKTLSTDMAFSPGYLEELIEDQPLSPFPHILFTERPDRAIAQLVEGRIVVMSEKWCSYR